MARTKQYQHYCPVARSLEVIGEKWSLLLVRDLLRGPQRFTDLLRYLGGITPKWLTLRLRDLEAAGIIERDCEQGRREVWYRLTAKGRDLAPVVDALAVWGIDHAVRPPLPGEPIHPEQTMHAMAAYRNSRGLRLSQPATWLVRWAPDRAHAIRYDGERWSVQRGEAAADVTVEATAEDWVVFVTSRPRERRKQVGTLRITGLPEQVAEFLGSFGVPAPAATAPPPAAPLGPPPAGPD